MKYAKNTQMKYIREFIAKDEKKPANTRVERLS